MSLIHPFNVDDLPMYEPQFSLSNPVDEVSPVEEIPPQKKKLPERRWIRTSEDSDNVNTKKKTNWFWVEVLGFLEQQMKYLVVHSGARDEDYTQKKLDEYRVEYGVPFTLLHAWKVFKDALNGRRRKFQDLKKGGEKSSRNIRIERRRKRQQHSIRQYYQLEVMKRWLDLLKEWLKDGEFGDGEFGDDRASNFEHCETTVKQWASSSLHSDTKDGHILKDLLFFLHVPRTGGRTYFYCFLKKLYSSSLECPRSYDKLRFDPRKRNCRLLATHDDYSIMSKLPRERTSVVTILRNPIDRVFSAYEFSVEVAARFLVHSNLTSATKTSRTVRLKKGVISTLDIWPWKYLVPWMMEDLFARRDARKRMGPPNAYGNDSYNMEEIVMPLHEFINHPVALDIIHNGATFQKRLDAMLYVGLTEDHRESATMFANLVGAQVISQFGALNAVTESEQGPFSKAGSGTSGDQDNNTWPNEAPLEIDSNKKTVNIMRRISPTNFTKEARLHVSEPVLKQIALMNSLDVELYKHAQKIFGRQHQVIDQNPLNSTMPDKWQMMHGKRLSYMGSAWEILYFDSPIQPTLTSTLYHSSFLSHLLCNGHRTRYNLLISDNEVTTLSPPPLQLMVTTARDGPPDV
ncbi:protein-tyrosine sulfotransferase-like protein isoform X3 [Tanacetum coccineum]|uniref:Protein-tyrosine sulfotransferase-like protein isoform X3 n=1 Tax=Tanacetum coccineum TaxID=301880 RepID=A0ABQ5B0K4_9ASTR